MAIVAVFTARGFLHPGPLDSSVGAMDPALSNALLADRTATLTEATLVGSTSADAFVKIPAIVVFGGLFLWRWKRWREAALFTGALVLETLSFVAVAFIVDRDRPGIDKLDTVPPTGSFPSGHTAAAVAFYGALAIVIFWHNRNAIVRLLAFAVAVVLPPIVAYSRMYRGMHALSDVVAGAVLGLASLLVVYVIVETAAHRGPGFVRRVHRHPIDTL
jgi:undecaprenyl-diphosphatase